MSSFSQKELKISLLFFFLGGGVKQDLFKTGFNFLVQDALSTIFKKNFKIKVTVQ